MKLSKLHVELMDYLGKAFTGQRYIDINVDLLMRTLEEDIMGTETKCEHTGELMYGSASVCGTCSETVEFHEGSADLL